MVLTQLNSFFFVSNRYNLCIKHVIFKLQGFSWEGGGVGVFGLRDFFGGFVFGFFEVANSSRASVIGIVIGVH